MASLPPGGRHSRSGGLRCVGEVSLALSVPLSLGGWLPPDIHGLHNWVFHTLEELNLFVSRVVSARIEAAVLSWKRWSNEDPNSRPFWWLIVLPTPYLVCAPDRTCPAGLDRCSVQKGLDAFFRREGRDPVTPEDFLDFVGGYLEQAREIDLPVLTGEDLHATVLARKATARGLHGWGWNELKALPPSCLVGLASALR